MDELVKIVTKFSESGWDVIDIPSKTWLSAFNESGMNNDFTKDLEKAIEKADKECGSCGCEFDSLYKKALELLHSAA